MHDVNVIAQAQLMYFLADEKVPSIVITKPSTCKQAKNYFLHDVERFELRALLSVSDSFVDAKT